MILYLKYELNLQNYENLKLPRILKESPELAMAIAAEHLIQVFYTHGSKLEQSEVATDVSKYSLHKFYILKI